MSLASPVVLARVRNVPSRAGAALLTFGGMLGLPALLTLLGGVLIGTPVEGVGVALILLACLVFFGTVVLAWIFIFSARSRIMRGQQSIYEGNFDAATKDALFVVRTTFRSDYQMGALFVLAFAAERAGAFAEAAVLFRRAIAMMPAMAGAGPAKRARALLWAHAAMDHAASHDIAGANDALAKCHQQLASTAGQGFDLLNDAAFGPIGVSSLLLDLENRRDPRPLAVVAQLLIGLKSGAFQQVLDLARAEYPTIQTGLAPNERALTDRIQSEAMRLLSGGGPHRAPGAMQPHDHSSAWALAALP